MSHLCASVLLVVVWLAVAPPAAACADEERVARTVAAFREHVPRVFFDEAYGYAVLPAVKRGGFGLGGAWGVGCAFEQGESIGGVRFWQLTSGIQMGGRSVSMMVFFRDEEAMSAFKLNRLLFMGQVGLAMLRFGRSKTPAYRSDVAVFAADGSGLMIEATIAGGKLALGRRGEASPSGAAVDRDAAE